MWSIWACCPQTAEPAKRFWASSRSTVVADSGYFKIEDIAACEKAGTEPHVPKPQRGPSVRAGLFRKDEFQLRPRQGHLCLPGEARACSPIPHRSARDEKDKLRQRPGLPRLPIAPAMHEQLASLRLPPENEDALDRMAARLGQRPDILARRREIVEHPFGTIKQWMNQGAFLMRGLDKVRAEFSLTALVYNLRRALNILGVARLMAAVQG